MLKSDISWYQNAVIYEIRVRSFYDGNGDGIGDFIGLTQKLDYLEALGVTAVWLLPFYLFPLKDDGYDISDYKKIHPECGSLHDFKAFLKEAHHRGIKVITELVLNHTSDQHPWFQRARRSKAESNERNFYVWSDSPDKYKQARVIFGDTEPSNWTFDPLAKSYFWHRFYSHQPDLNFDHPDVHKALFDVVDYWFRLGVDGVRLDAIPYLYEREGTTCENLPETHGFLKKLRTYIDENFQDRLLLAEANQWPDEAAAYFGKGDECHLAFHFPLMPRLFMSLHMEDRTPIVDILEQTPTIPVNAHWALFLRNHDELTLEMVTDEERDYMVRVYAADPRAKLNLGIRRRLAPLLGNNRRKIELINGLLLSLPGTPVIYYGDEIGMGDNIFLGDRNGVRTPMQWNADRNAGFSSASPQRLILPVVIESEYHYETLNVDAQNANIHSLLWWMRRLIALRKRYQAFSIGSFELLDPENSKTLCYVRRFADQVILVVTNLSRYVQPVELNLTEFKGCRPIELFGQTAFPEISDSPYFLSLAPHGFLWFSLESKGKSMVMQKTLGLQSIEVSDVEAIFEGHSKAQLEMSMVPYLQAQRWFLEEATPIKQAKIIDHFKCGANGKIVWACLVQVDYLAGKIPEKFFVPLALEWGDSHDSLSKNFGSFVVSLIQLKNKGTLRFGAVIDALSVSWGAEVLFQLAIRERTLRSRKGTLSGHLEFHDTSASRENEISSEVSVVGKDQQNTSVIFNKKLIHKTYRRLQEGPNPDLEMSQYLTRKNFLNTPVCHGYLEVRSNLTDAPITVGLIQSYVQNQNDAWDYSLDELDRFFERVMAQPHQSVPGVTLFDKWFPALSEEPAQLIREMMGSYLEFARNLGQRTAEMHICLSEAPRQSEFSSEEMTLGSQRSLFQSIRSQISRSMRLLQKKMAGLPSSLEDHAKKALQQQTFAYDWIAPLKGNLIPSKLIRCHGDFHLGQVLYTGKDVFIIDFEGEPSRSISERKIKRVAFRDVAGIMRSFDYAAQRAYLKVKDLRKTSPGDCNLEAWAHTWQFWSGVVFLRQYLASTQDYSFLPPKDEDKETLLRCFYIEKLHYELEYELSRRQQWIGIPLKALNDILKRNC